MAMAVVFAVSAMAVAFLVWFEIRLLRDSSRPFAIYHVEYCNVEPDSPLVAADRTAVEDRTSAA